MLDLRSRFALPEPPTLVELRAFTHGLMPRTVPSMMARFADDWHRCGVDAWNEVPNHWLPESGEVVGWWTLPEYLGDRFVAPLLGAGAGTCILQPNAHWVVQCLLSAPEPFASGRNEVVLTDAEFPSVGHSAVRWAEMLGFGIRIVPATAEGFVDQERLLESVSARTAWVFVSHVGFASGERLPDEFLSELVRVADEHGALVAIDGYHAAGSIPIYVERLGAHVYFGGLLKEASGSSGNAFVYVKRGVQLTPRISGWFAAEDPFAFLPAHVPSTEVRRRFLSGTPAVASMYHAVEGVRLLLEASISAVRADSLEKTALCLASCDRMGVRVASPRAAERRSAMVILDLPRADLMSHFLRERGILTDSRKERFLRMAPFVWNTVDDIGRLMTALEEGIAGNKYLHTRPAASAGPVT